MNLPFSRWLMITLVCAAVLLWRVVDFTGEAFAGGYHMTRAGLHIFGHEAEILQILLILGVLGGLLISLRQLVLARSGTTDLR